MAKFDDYAIMKIPEEEVISKMNTCPIDSSFKILGQKFMILILRDLILFGKKGLVSNYRSYQNISNKGQKRNTPI